MTDYNALYSKYENRVYKLVKPIGGTRFSTDLQKIIGKDRWVVYASVFTVVIVILWALRPPFIFSTVTDDEGVETNTISGVKIITTALVICASIAFIWNIKMQV